MSKDIPMKDKQKGRKEYGNSKNQIGRRSNFKKTVETGGKNDAAAVTVDRRYV